MSRPASKDDYVRDEDEKLSYKDTHDQQSDEKATEMQKKLGKNNRVLLYGLKTKVYNARIGTITSDLESGRYGVTLDYFDPLNETKTKKVIRVRRANLFRLPDGEYDVVRAIIDKTNRDFANIFALDVSTQSRMHSLNEVVRVYVDAANPRTRDAWLKQCFSDPIYDIIAGKQIPGVVDEIVSGSEFKTLRTTALFLAWRISTEPNCAYTFIENPRLTHRFVDLFLEHYDKLIARRSKPLPEFKSLHKVDQNIQNGAFAFATLANLSGYRWGDLQKPLWIELWAKVGSKVLKLCGEGPGVKSEQNVCEQEFIRGAVFRFLSGILSQRFEIKPNQVREMDRIATLWDSKLLLGFLYNYHTTQ